MSALVFGLLCPSAPAGADRVAGAVVERAESGSEAALAGLAEGDSLLSWARGEATGAIASPFELLRLEDDERPQGPVTVTGLRGAERREWTLGPRPWGLETRPAFGGALLSQYEQARTLAAAGETRAAGKALAAVADQLGPSEPAWLRAWLVYRAAGLLAEAREWTLADASYGNAAGWAVDADPVIRAEIFVAWGVTSVTRADWPHAERRLQDSLREWRRAGPDGLKVALILDYLGEQAWALASDLGKALDYHRQALEITRRLAPGSLALAASLGGVGSMASVRGDLDVAEAYLRESLDIREKIAPGSLETAGSLNGLGDLFLQRGDLAKAEELCRRALAIREALVPGSLDVAGSLDDLGLIAYSKADDLDAAEAHLQRALEIKRRLAPDGLSEALTLDALSGVFEDRGDLDQAEEYGRRALAIRERVAPQSLDVAFSLAGLGGFAFDRRDLAKAEDYQRRALAIWEALAPGSQEVATGLHSLARIMAERGDLDQAEEYDRRALTVHETLAPGGLEAARCLDHLGTVAQARRDLAAAEGYFRRALDIRGRLAPSGLDAAGSLGHLGDLALDKGDLDAAETFGRRALAIHEKLAPDSLELARSVELLGDVANRRGERQGAEGLYRRAIALRETLAPESLEHARCLASLASVLGEQQWRGAAELFARALRAFEGQAAHLGGGQAQRAGFREKFIGHYREYAALLSAHGQPERALEVLERSRAQTLLETLAAGRVDVHKDVDPALLEQERALRESLGIKSDRRIRLLGREHTEQQLAAASAEIERLLAQHQQLEGRIRASSPGYAALVRPQPVTAQEIQQLLDADTVLLEYTLGEEGSRLWVVTPDDVTSHELPKRSTIEPLARRFYELLTARGRVTPDESELARRKRVEHAEAELPATAAALSRVLLEPAAALLGEKRLVVVSDGILDYLPFAALPEPSGPAPLAVRHEIVRLPSASVLATLRQQTSGRKRPPRMVAVLADPVFDEKDPRIGPRRAPARAGPTPPAAANDTLTRSAIDVGLARDGRLQLPRLVFSRQEARAIRALMPAGEELEALDFDANRATATSPLLAQYRVVHFATHGLLDSEHPELSGLVLSLVDENGVSRRGFLELQDVYNLDLPVELVVLSACETGLGRQIKGEGLVGLTRGFMYAGAPRVIASLWNVDDVATAELMARFYRGLEQDALRPAAALRRAQVELRRETRWSSPYYWAAFQIQGEWR